MNSINADFVSLSRKPADVFLSARNLEQPDYSKIRKNWFGENAVLTTSTNVFSIYIPRGEKFFIKSVRYFEDQIKDPELQELVKTFIKQEANHYKAHEVFNNGLEHQGIRSIREQHAAEKLFTFMEKWLPKKMQLGITVFDEHLTATGAKLLLESQALAETLDPEMRTLWEWHAVEEIEHKSVAFDVYEAMGCGYFHRMFSALVGTIIQGIFIIGSEGRLLKEQGIKRFGAEGKEAGKILGRVLNLKKLAREFVLYFKPGFHPWDIDDRAFIQAWYNKNPHYNQPS